MAIDPKLLRLNSSYSRAELGDIFGDEKIASSREGLYPDGDRVIFFVTLDKEDRDQTVSYEDYFADGLFFWESQSTQAPHQKISEKFCPARWSRSFSFGKWLKYDLKPSRSYMQDDWSTLSMTKNHLNQLKLFSIQ